VKVMALDYGRARTGVAVSDPTGSVARPLGVVENVDEEDGFETLLRVIQIEQPDRIVVGLPLTLGGARGEQARETEEFAENLRDVVEVPIELYDERFTTDLAESDGGAAEEDARAAAHLLSSYLEWASRRPT
jgi:putative Holliday junction resolvase